MDELQAVDTNYAQCYTDIKAPEDVPWKVSLFLRSPCHPLSDKMQAVHKGSHPGQYSVYLMPVVDIDY